MKKPGLFTCMAALLAAIAGSAGAAESAETSALLQLSDGQMDRVAAGAQTSYAGGSATAWYGFVVSNSQTGTMSAGPLEYTTASSLNFAIGVQPTATAYAGSTF